MEHCLSCNSTLKTGEKECWACSAVVAEKNPKTSLHARFQTVIKVLFIMFAVLTPLALVLPLLTPVGVKTQVTRIVSPALARVIGEASGVKYVVQEALFAPTVVTKWPVETVAVPEPV